MKEIEKRKFFERCADEGPQSAMEMKLLEEYLAQKGYTLTQLQTLPKAQADKLMKEACQYASLKLAHHESTARFRDQVLKKG